MTDLVIARQVPPGDEAGVRAALVSPGRRIGRLVIRGANAMGYVVCQCDCGETLAAPAGRIAEGELYQCRSCSKYDAKPPARRLMGDRRYRGLMSRARAAKRRCEDPRRQNYDRYGGRGIRFLFEAVEHYAVAVFIHGSAHGSRGFELEVDRIDNDGPYAPDNIRLIPHKENTRNREITFMVQGRPLGEIAEQHGLDGIVRYNSLRSAILRKTAETGSEPGMDFVLRHIERLKTKEMRLRPHAKKREPLLVEGVPAMDVIGQCGLAGNKIAYAKIKDLIRRRRDRGAQTTIKDVREYLAARFPPQVSA